MKRELLKVMTLPGISGEQRVERLCQRCGYGISFWTMAFESVVLPEIPPHDCDRWDKEAKRFRDA